MKILFYGSDALLARVRRQVNGQSWDIYRAEDPDHVFDYEDTHSFQAALFGLCENDLAVRAATWNAKNALDIPVAIGLASQDQVMSFSERTQNGLDIVVPECGNDRLTKHQCDAILRFANGSPAERISCGGVSFHMADDRFSVNGQSIYLPYKKHKLLELLFLKRGRTVTKEMVFNHLYGWEEPPEAKIVDVFICQIRRALREAGLKEECIQTVWGQGYRVPDKLDTEGRSAA
ncbi:winged helix-turn-helix domain-containing protein [uncultured Tateyamaria sp.]|uniref:winged helix-turn-helix domain-containing protein n=1 Tax=uncultured Tateyamaria sp. TaxID=455651 RepID=UPI002610FCD8|nr:winged helix-turn-helix domain-containing protein [uncultured Tateyamaria sp.]